MFEVTTVSRTLKNNDLHIDQNVLEKLRRGEQDVFRELHYQFRVRLIYFVVKMGVGHKEAEDIVSDSFLKLWQQRESIQSIDYTRNFLYAVCRNSALNLLDFKKRQKGYLDRYHDMQPAFQEAFSYEKVTAELMHAIDQGIQTLPPECRKVFELYMEDIEPKEIAKRLSISAGTVRSQKRKAIQLLKKWADNHRGELISLLLFIVKRII